jgi:hypothetical protein
LHQLFRRIDASGMPAPSAANIGIRFLSENGFPRLKVPWDTRLTVGIELKKRYQNQ